MKKIIALAFIVLAIASHNAFGQAMINVKEYSSYFLDTVTNIISGNYSMASTDEDYDKIAALGGSSLGRVDTPLEIALLSTCAGVIDIRPAEANAILPKNNPKLSDQKLGAAVFQEIQVLRFLGDTAAVSRHEAILKFITDRKNATRAEIETYYRNGIRGLVSDIVDEEFGKAGKEGIIPTRVYADWERQKLVVVNGKAVNGTELIKQTLTNFFLNPTENNYIRLRGIIARILADESINNQFGLIAEVAWKNTITFISPELQNRLTKEFNRATDTYTAAKQPNDPAFRIFEILYK